MSSSTGVTPVALACQKLLQGFAILGRYGLGAKVAGHLTQRHPEREAFWTHRFGLGFDEIRRGDLLLVDFDLRPLEEEIEINPTMHIHAQIYRARSDVRAIAHTHGANLVALSATTAEFLPCSQMAGIFLDDIRFFDEEDLIALRPEQGAGMAGILGQLSVLVLRNHGSLVVGPAMEDVVLRTLALEEAAEVQLKAMSLGAIRPMGRRSAAQVKSFVLSPPILRAYWDYEIRQLARPAPRVGGLPPSPTDQPGMNTQGLDQW